MSSLRRYLKIFWHCLVIVIGIFIGYSLHSDHEENLRTRAVETEKAIQSIESDLVNSQGIVDRYTAAKDGFRPYISFLFPPMKPEALIEEIRSLALSYRVNLSDIQLDVPKFIEIRGKEEAISIVPFEISFTGDFFSLGKFLEELEKAPYLQNLSDMGMSIKDDSGIRIRLSLKGAFRFFQKEVIEELVNDGV